MAEPGKVKIPVEVDYSRVIAGAEAASRAFAGMAAVAAELAENLRKIGVDKPSTTV